MKIKRTISHRNSGIIQYSTKELNEATLTQIKNSLPKEWVPSPFKFDGWNALKYCWKNTISFSVPKKGLECKIILWVYPKKYILSLNIETLKSVKKEIEQFSSDLDLYLSNRQIK